MAKYTVRPPFAVHLEWFEDQLQGNVKRRVKREQSYFYGTDPVEIDDEDAIAHMHKLEPVDEAAKKLFGEHQTKQEAARSARQAQDGNTKTLAAQVAEGVISGLIAAGILKSKDLPKDPPKDKA